MHKHLLAACALAACAAPAFAQSSVTVYGRVDLSIAQQADAVANKEIRNGSGSRLGFRGTEDLGDGLKAVFHIEHRFNADTGAPANTTRLWEGKSIVGLQGSFGTVSLGREENPAYTFGQTVADPWGTDTVASNGTIVAGRIGSTRYSDSVNWRYSAQGLNVGLQFTESDGFEKRPYSVGLGYTMGDLQLGFGHENPGDKDDSWTTVYAGMKFGDAKAGLFFGTGKNASAQKHQAWLLSATWKVGAGEARFSYGQLENKDVAANGIADKQLGLGHHHGRSKRTTVYVDLVNEKRDALPSNRKKTGWDLGIRHNF